MPSFVPLGPRARVASALLAAAACVAAAIAGVAACLTAPPPDVSTGGNLRPEIVHTALEPQEGTLTEWPAGFVVPVRVGSDGVCEYSIYYVVGTTYSNKRFPLPAPCPTSTLDGGIVTVTFNYPPTDPTACQDVVFTVAHKFSIGQSGTPVIVPDSNSGDQARWQYRPIACFTYDAGPLADGAFPEAASDGPLVIPEAGGDP